MLLNLSTAAQQQKTDHAAAIRATVTGYIEGYYTGDATRMEKSLHAHYLKHTISKSVKLRNDGENWAADGAGCTLE